MNKINKKTIGLEQNKYNKSYAQNVIEKLSEEEKKSQIEELEKIGYGYNEGIHILLTLEKKIPYEFVFYCLLLENYKN